MRTVLGAALVPLAALLVGCSPPEIFAEPTTSLTASPGPSATAANAFTMPTTCLEILADHRLVEFEAEGFVLLGGPDGLYGDEYLLDPSPEQRVGGITCIWGSPETEISSVTISVAPLVAATRPAIASNLKIVQGLNESVGETATYYWQLGDDDHEPAILNVLTTDSWISVIQTIGGDANYTAAEQLALDVHYRVYSAT